MTPPVQGFRLAAGQVRGVFTLLEKIPTPERYVVRWRCRCKCGSIREIRARTLLWEPGYFCTCSASGTRDHLSDAIELLKAVRGVLPARSATRSLIDQFFERPDVRASATPSQPTRI